MQYTRSKQYLKAMGITVWEPRGQQPAQQVPQPVPQPVAHEVAPQTSVTPLISEAATSKGGLPVACSTDTNAYLNALAETPVMLSQSQPGDLLLVVEPPALTGEGTALLSAMLKAIQYDITTQSIATLDASSAQTLSTVVRQTGPKMVIVMVCHRGNSASLHTHRAALHQPGWADVPVAITIHPHELLADPANKRPAWEDLKRVKARLG